MAAQNSFIPALAFWALTLVFHHVIEGMTVIAECLTVNRFYFEFGTLKDRFVNDDNWKVLFKENRQITGKLAHFKSDELNPMVKYKNKEVIYNPSVKLMMENFIVKYIKDLEKEERNSINDIVLNYLNREILKEDSPIFHYTPAYFDKYVIYKLATLDKLKRFERDRLTEDEFNELMLPLKKR